MTEDQANELRMLAEYELAWRRVLELFPADKVVHKLYDEAKERLELRANEYGLFPVEEQP